MSAHSNGAGRLVSAAKWTQEPIEASIERLGVAREAAQLFQESCVIDLHIDSFIWQRVLGYRLDRAHGPGLLRGRFGSQVDFPRLRQVGVNAATWVITTNPFKPHRSRLTTFKRNLLRLEQTLDAQPGDIVRASTADDVERARNEGRHAAFIGVQGGNALSDDPNCLEDVDLRRLLRVTLTHLTHSWLGHSSTPWGFGSGGLSDRGREVVRRLNHTRVLVDLAHIDRQGFFDALQAHDPSLPPIVTHTGVSGVHPHWRNLTDDQLKAIADRGGTIGIMYHTPYLASGFGRRSVDCVAAHIEHVIRTVGDDFVSLGSDWDGAIITPYDMPTCLELPRLVDALLRRRVPPESIEKLLGLNFLRVLRLLRG